LPAFDKLQQRDDSLMNHKLLTIAIPTYNRSRYLDQCLAQLSRQVPEFEREIELLISDNCSTDDTRDIVTKYSAKGISITYTINKENLGVDKNVIKCFDFASSKYVLVLGDDDIILDGALSKIIPLLRENDFGVLYLSSYGFKNNYLTERPKIKLSGVEVFDDVERYLKKVNYWITFLSGNVVNKSVLQPEFVSSRFMGTNLVQLNWILTAVFSGPHNAIVHDYVVAAKIENTGGYSICKVFGINLNAIMNDLLVGANYKPVIKHINNLLLRQFLPGIILNIRKRKAGFNFEDYGFYNELKPLYSSYVNFWLYLAPVMKFPLYLAIVWHFIVRIINKIARATPLRIFK